MMQQEEGTKRERTQPLPHEEIGWVMIPPFVTYRKDISANAKLLYGRITGLVGKKGYCWACNRWLGDQLGLKSHTVYSLLRELVEKGLVETEVIRNECNQVVERRIFLTTPSLPLGRDSLTDRRDLPSVGKGPSLMDGRDPYIGIENRDRIKKNPPIAPPQSDSPNGGESPSHRKAPKGSTHPVDDNLVGDRSIRYWPKEFVKDPAFQKAWSEWCEYRQAKKKPVAKLTTAGFTKEVSRILQDIGRTPQQVIGAIENSMARDWQGIYKSVQPQQVHQTLNGNRILQSRNGRAHSVVPQNGEIYDFPEKTTVYDNSNWIPTA